MPSRRESFCRGRPPEIVICVPKPRCACPVDCVRAVATPGSSAARSEAERPLRGRSVTLFELTTPVTPEAPPSPPLVLVSACITISARLTVPAITVTVVCHATKPFAVTRTSKTPGRRLRNERSRRPSRWCYSCHHSPCSLRSTPHSQSERQCCSQFGQPESPP